MSRFRLEPLEGGIAFPLVDGRTVIVGRGKGSALRLEHDTVSRQHAELRAQGDSVTLRDLGSSNGTWVNGARVTEARLRPGDIVTFGGLRFRVHQRDPAVDLSPDRAVPLSHCPSVTLSPDLPQGTLVRAIPLAGTEGALASLRAERLARLVELARALSGEIDLESLLVMVVDQAAALLPVDRVALLLTGAEGETELVAAHARNRLDDSPVQVPRSIAGRAIAERTPISTENALEDPRFRSGSVVAGQVRAALCVPLLADEGLVVGALYLDSLTAAQPFSEEDAALCLAFGGLAAVSIAKARFAEAARREALARANLERFFAPQVAARIAQTRGDLHPGGERRPVIVLMSDVRGFTALAETLTPEAVATQLSEYFAAMVELVFAHGGTLDKLAGDALLAVWGAPAAAPDDADRALAAARAMHAEVARLNAGWRHEGRPSLAIGIGLHYGDAFTGAIGSPRRMDYTVIGDMVNVAARLCDAAKAGEIVLSEAVQERLRAPAALGPRELLQLRGREERVAGYREAVTGDR